MHSLHQKYGPVVRVSPEEVDICDLDAAKVIHRARGGFLKSARFYRTLSAVETLFSTTDPAFHSAHRRLLANPISDSSLTRFEPLVADRVRLTIDKMSDEFESRGAMDVFKWWFFMATDVIGELSFGESFRMLDSGKVCIDAIHFTKDEGRSNSTENPIYRGSSKPRLDLTHPNNIPLTRTTSIPSPSPNFPKSIRHKPEIKRIRSAINRPLQAHNRRKRRPKAHPIHKAVQRRQGWPFRCRNSERRTGIYSRRK